MKFVVLLVALLAVTVSVQATIFSAAGNRVQDGWVIRFHPNTEAGIRSQHFTHPLLAQANIVKEYNFNEGKFLAYAVTGIDAATAIALHDLPEIMDITPNIQVRLFDEDFKMEQYQAKACERSQSKSWGLSRTVHFGRLPTNQPIEKIPYEMDSAACGRGIELHVFDTGVYGEHKDFQGRVRWGVDGTGEGEFDGHGHGSHVASTSGGATYGLARCADIVAIKVLNSEGAGSLFSILAGVEYSMERAKTGAKIVINMSLGALRNDLLNGIMTNAVEAGILVVAAAGNSNENSEYFSPASAEGVFTVAASTKEDVRSEFSNWGSIVDIFGPGSLITGAWIGAPDAERTVSGTSMACPHAAGVAVKVWSQNPRLTNTQVKERIIRMSNPNVITDTKDVPNRLLFHSCSSN